MPGGGRRGLAELRVVEDGVENALFQVDGDGGIAGAVALAELGIGMHAGVVEVPLKAGGGDAAAFGKRDDTDGGVGGAGHANGASRGNAVDILLFVEEADGEGIGEGIGDEEVIEEMVDAAAGAAEDEQVFGGFGEVPEGFFEISGGGLGGFDAGAGNGGSGGGNGIKIAYDEVGLAVDGVEGIEAGVGGDDVGSLGEGGSEEAGRGRLAAEDENGIVHLGRKGRSRSGNGKGFRCIPGEEGHVKEV